jgi:hypothetical protein
LESLTFAFHHFLISFVLNEGCKYDNVKGLVKNESQMHFQHETYEVIDGVCI